MGTVGGSVTKNSVEVKMDTYFHHQEIVTPFVKNGQLDQAIAHCEKALAALHATAYHKAIGKSWLERTKQAAQWLSDFYRTCKAMMPVQAIYCEMNRFEINADCWYIDGFAYDFFGDPDELGWIRGWKKHSGEENRFVLEGMEDLQRSFAKDCADVPPSKVRKASEVVILLLTLRMQELVQAAARMARELGKVPANFPVLATAHDSDLICVCYGSKKPAITWQGPARPIASPPARKDGKSGIYKLDGGWDEFHNSLPWDVLDFVKESDFETVGERLDKAKPLAKVWKPPKVKLRLRKWRCDLISLCPHWAITPKAGKVLLPLLGQTVEFLPLDCAEVDGLFVIHALHHVELAASALHNGQNGDNMTRVEKYVFEPEELQGLHFFDIKQAPGSDARKAGFSFGESFVSEEFKRTFVANRLQGVVFDEVFAY